MIDASISKDTFTIVTLGVLTLILFYFYTDDFLLKYERRRSSTFVRTILRKVLYAISLEISVVLLFFALSPHDAMPPSSSPEDKMDLSARIESIASDLDNASTQLPIIQKELEQRIEYVENLKREAEIAENVISLTEEQVNAVQSKLNEELNANSEKSLVQDIILNSFFFVLGLIAPGIVNILKKLFKKDSTDDIDSDSEHLFTQEQIDQAIRLLDIANNKANCDK